MKSFALVLAALSVGMNPGCATLSGSNGSKVEVALSQDSYLQQPNLPTIRRKSGETVEVEEYPVLIESPGFVSILVVPQPREGSHAVQVKLKPFEDWGGEAFNHKLSQSISAIVSEMNEVQILLSRARPEEADQKMTQLQSLYPDIGWLGFLKASCLVAKGETEKAKVVLEKALREFPNDPAGLQLYGILSGQGATTKTSTKSRRNENPPENGISREN